MGIFLDLKYLKFMKKYILIILVSVLSLSKIFCQTTKQKFRIERIKCVNENGFVNITFNLVNITNDTLYLSDKNLNIRLIKNHKSINWDYPKVHVQPFVKPVLKNGEQIDDKIKILNKEDPKDKLAKNFATKLFFKNLNANVQLIKYKEIIVKNIVDDCTILLPAETYNYEIGFYSKKFDKTCKVSVKYLDNKRFTYFVDDSGKKIDLID
jgi:hypothetical protein